MNKFDVAIIGGGPGGSTAGAILAKAGIKTVLFEREIYPRFHIGESLLPASIPIFKRTGFHATMEAGKYIKKYGARFIDYATDDEVYFGFEDGFNTDIPSAYEVPRSEFDRDILEHAKICGADVKQPERVKSVTEQTDGLTLLTNKGEYFAKYVIDASGRDSFLGRKWTERNAHKDLNNVAVFAHYTDVKRFEGKNEGDIAIGLLPDKSWTWVIPFKGDRTSVGVVCGSNVFKRDEDFARYLEEQVNRCPRIRAMMQNAERVTEVTVIANYSHHSDRFYGSRWILSGDAAVFLDPIFSSGVHVSMSTSMFAADVTIEALQKGLNYTDESLGELYQAKVKKGVQRFHNLISLFYEGQFVAQMKKTLTRENMRKGFTSAVAGDVWNDDNHVFRNQVL